MSSTCVIDASRRFSTARLYSSCFSLSIEAIFAADARRSCERAESRRARRCAARGPRRGRPVRYARRGPSVKAGRAVRHWRCASALGECPYCASFASWVLQVCLFLDWAVQGGESSYNESVVVPAGRGFFAFPYLLLWVGEWGLHPPRAKCS